MRLALVPRTTEFYALFAAAGRTAPLFRSGGGRATFHA